MPVVVKCQRCQKEIRAKPSLARQTKYCSWKCRYPNSTATSRRGADHPNWKGGRSTNKEGYIYIYAPDHPRCTAAGYIFEHRLVMEQMLGRYLEPHEEVHHLNGVHDDNRPENLELWTRKHPPGQRSKDLGLTAPTQMAAWVALSTVIHMLDHGTSGEKMTSMLLARQEIERWQTAA